MRCGRNYEKFIIRRVLNRFGWTHWDWDAGVYGLVVSVVTAVSTESVAVSTAVAAVSTVATVAGQSVAAVTDGGSVVAAAAVSPVAACRKTPVWE